ncbi:MAG: OmpA family protein, partial [Thermodesulfobacteriota bacterium]|nr:OmpA family protein [Thermodesulfobacteriota bacterium]
LITFFVLLISMSSMNDKAFNDVFGFFNDAIGPLEFATRHSVEGLPSLVPEIKTRSLLDSTSLSRSLLNAMEKKNIGGVLGRGIDPFEVKSSSRGLAIVIQDNILFTSGSSRLSAEAISVLSVVASTISDTDAMISIEGYSDNIGDKTRNFRLSLKRAQSVLDCFVYRFGMSPSRFVLAGYGSSRPVQSNESEYGRQRNRRVEIVLLRDRF